MQTQTPAVRDGLRLLAATVAVVVLLAAAWAWSPLLLQVFAAVLLAIALRGGADGLGRLTGIGTVPGVLAVLALVVAAVALAVRLAGPAIADQFDQLVGSLPQSWQQLSDRIGENPIGAALMRGAEDATGTDAEGMAQMARKLPDLFGMLMGTLNAAMGSVTALLLILVVAIYFAMDAGTYRGGMVRLVPPARRARAGDILTELHHKLAHWMAGQALDMLIVAILAGLGLWLLEVPLALILAVIAGLTNIVPIIGPFLSGAVAVVAAAPQGMDTALWVALLFAAIQVIEGNVLLPMIQRQAVSLPPAMTILAIVAVGALFHPAAVVLATPLLIVATVLIRRIYVEDVLGDQTLRDSDT